MAYEASLNFCIHGKREIIIHRYRIYSKIYSFFSRCKNRFVSDNRIVHLKKNDLMEFPTTSFVRKYICKDAFSNPQGILSYSYI